MSVRFIFKIIPVPVFYKELKTFAGKSFGLFIVIDPKHKDNMPLLAHELNHCKQFWATLGLHALAYKFIKRYRYNSEVGCYRVQLNARDDQGVERARVATVFARFIATRYNLNINIPRTRDDILDGDNTMWLWG